MWVKKMKHKKGNLILIGLVLFTTAVLLNMCIGFTLELIKFSKEGINESNSPDSYILSVGTKELKDNFKDDTYKSEVEWYRALAGKTIPVPMKYKDKDISMNFDMMLSAKGYKDFKYMELVQGDKSAKSPNYGEVWISETLAGPNNIGLGEEIILQYESPVKLSVSGIYRTTCFPRPVGFSPIIVSDNQIKNDRRAENAALFAVNVKDYSDKKVKELFKDSEFAIVQRSRDDVQGNLIEYSSVFGLIGGLAGSIVFIVTLVILRFVIKSNIIKEFRVIGIYKSLGYRSKDIMGFYIKGYLLVGSIAITLGSLASLPITRKLGEVSTEYVEGFELSQISLIISLITIISLLIILYINLNLALRRIGKISPIEAISVGKNLSETKLPKSIIKNAKSPFEMSINEVFKYKKSTLMMMVIITVSMYLSMVFTMVWYSSSKMIENSNLWFSLPKSEAYIVGNLNNDLYKYLEESEYIKTSVNGDFSYSKKIYLEDFENYISFDIYSEFSEEVTGIKLLEGVGPKGKDDVVVGINLLQETNLNIGDNISLRLNGVSKNFKITGSYNTVADSGRKLMINKEGIRKFIPNYESSRVYITMKNPSDYPVFKEELELKFKGVHINTKWTALENSVESIRDMLQSISAILVIAISLFSVLNIIIVVLMDNKNWRRKYGIMKALGFSSNYIIKLNIYKYLIISSVSTAVSLGVHLLISKKTAGNLLVDAFINSNKLLIILILGFIISGLIATLGINLSVKKIEVIELMEE